MNQNPRYVTSPLMFNQLNFYQFVGGEICTILRTDEETEYLGRLRLLSKIAYLYDQCKDWEKARNVYFAVVSSIEEGESEWSYSFGHYDMMCPPKSEENTYNQRGEIKTHSLRTKIKKEFYCRDFQKGECTLQSPHKSWIKNTYENVEHFCLQCYKAKLGKNIHVPGSDECVNRK